jgi:hypothetical protein
MAALHIVMWREITRFVACCILLVCLVGGTADEVNAAAFHAKAMELVQAGNYPLALANFRAACRHNDKSSLYWNDLGVTEMRMGELQKALKRFKRALSIDPNSAVAKDNIEELSHFMPPGPPQDKSNVTKSHRIQPPSRLSSAVVRHLSSILETPYSQVSSDDRAWVDAILSEPFVVEDAFPLFGITDDRILEVFNRQFLTSRFGDRRVDFYPHNMIEVQAHPYFLSFAPALYQLLHKPEEAYVGVDASEPGTYIQWNLDAQAWQELMVELLGATMPGMLDDRRWTQHCLGQGTQQDSSLSVNSDGDVASDGDNIQNRDADVGPDFAQTERSASHFFLSTHWQMLLVGEAGAGMFHHQDTLRTASWQLQLVGAKKWHLCGPEQTPFMYEAGKIDLFAPDYASFPLLRNATCYEVTVQAGEMLYYPHDYWHQTVNLETPSIALSSTLLTPYSYAQTAEELRRECAGAGRIFPPQQDMCDVMEKCYSVWEEMYGM